MRDFKIGVTVTLISHEVKVSEEEEREVYVKLYVKDDNLIHSKTVPFCSAIK